MIFIYLFGFGIAVIILLLCAFVRFEFDRPKVELGILLKVKYSGELVTFLGGSRIEPLMASDGGSDWDSAYLTNCFKVGWHKTWTVNGWRNSRGKPVENSDIWKPLVNLVAEHGNVTFEWVKGHSGDYGNDMADKLATEVVAMTVGDGR